MAVDAVGRQGFLPCPLWLETSHRVAAGRDRIFPGQRIASRDGEVAYRIELSLERDWVVAEHRVGGRATLPGTAYVELARSIAAQHYAADAVELRDLQLLAPLTVGASGPIEVFAILEPRADTVALRVTSRPVEHGTGTAGLREHMRVELARGGAAPPAAVEVDAVRRRCREATLEAGARSDGIDLGPRWRCLEGLLVGEREGLALLALPGAFAGDGEVFALHPALLDVAVGAAKRVAGAEGAYLPLSYGLVKVHAPLESRCVSHIRVRGDDRGGVLRFDIVIARQDGAPLVEIEDYTLRRLSVDAAKSIGSHEQDAAATPADLLAGAIGSDEGVEALTRALARRDVPQIVISPLDLQEVIAKWKRAETSLLADLETARVPRPAAAPAPRAAPYIEPRDEIERMVAALWGELLGLDRVGIDDNFFLLGGDSLLGIQLVARLKAAFPVDLPLAIIFDGPTVAEVAATVVRALEAKIDSAVLASIEGSSAGA
jgi:hypothetical protein